MTDIETAKPDKVCSNLARYDDSVTKAYQKHQIGGAVAQNLRAASAAFGKVTNCQP